MKLTRTSFAKELVLGNIGGADFSIDAMYQVLNEGSVAMTKQGLDFRLTGKA